MNFRDLADRIEEHFRAHPVVTVAAAAFAGIVLGTIPLNFVPQNMLGWWVMIGLEVTGMVVAETMVIRIGRRTKRSLKKLDHELDRHVLNHAHDLTPLLRSPGRVASWMRRALASLLYELGREAREFGRQYYDPGDDRDCL